MFYHPIIVQMLAAEHRADMERKRRHQWPGVDSEVRRQRRGRGQRRSQES